MNPAMNPMTPAIPLAIPDPHPACEGHFPGAPVVPAVVLLEEVLHAVEAGPGGPLTVSSAKFMAPVRPGQVLELRHETRPNGDVGFTLRRGPETVVSGVLRPVLEV